eukprot:CAMPEP_0203670932 /NCGR_PEP_ID=MMETSP0090-20130426/6872_1 /ASSEMBLY_ACC=CAM_ASM_001088 /TAXON_ID=426623 /ORGANISM="Chaetoceros affinis, Strain CCMP159" /LENGTH=700 /DNA_ID=CAMNT_0050535915 /DNA_START=73 /DNA_END=2172 /DNA_ORIENTATION=-
MSNDNFTYYNPELKRRSSLRNLSTEDSTKEDFFAIITALSEDPQPRSQTQEDEKEFVPFMMIQERTTDSGENRSGSPSSAIAEDSLSVRIDPLLQSNEECNYDHSSERISPKRNSRFKIDPSALEGKETLTFESASNSTYQNTETESLAKELKDLTANDSSGDVSSPFPIIMDTSEGKINRKRPSQENDDHRQTLDIKTKRLRPESNCDSKNNIYREGRRSNNDCDHLDVLSSKKDLSVAILNAQQYHQEAQAAAAGENNTLPPGASTSLVSFHYYGTNGIPPPQAYQITTAGATSATSTATEPSQTSVPSKGVDGQVPPQNSEHSLILGHHQKQPSSRSMSEISHKTYSATTSNHSTSSAFTSFKRVPPNSTTPQCNHGDHQAGTNLQDQGYDMVEDPRISYHNNGLRHESPFQHAKKDSMTDFDHTTAPATYSYFADEKVLVGNTGMSSSNGGGGNKRYSTATQQPAYHQHMPHPSSPVRYTHHDDSNSHHYHQMRDYQGHYHYRQPNYDSSIHSDPHPSNPSEKIHCPPSSSYYQGSSSSSSYAPPPQDSSSQYYFYKGETQEGADSRDYMGPANSSGLYSRDSGHYHHMERSSSARRGGNDPHHSAGQHMNHHIMAPQRHCAPSNPVYQHPSQERYYEDNREQGMMTSSENHEPMPSLNAHPSWHHNSHSQPPPLQAGVSGQLLPYYNRQILPLST